MKNIRVFIIIVAVGLMGITMHLGCGGGAIPFGEGAKMDDVLDTAIPPVEIEAEVEVGPEAVEVPVVTDKRGDTPLDKPGEPCLMNYALILDPDFLLAIRMTPPALKVAALLNFDVFKTVVADPKVIDDIMAYGDELVVAGLKTKESGAIILLRMKEELLGGGEADVETFLANLALAINGAYQPPLAENVYAYARFDRHPRNYVVARQSVLQQLVDQEVEEACQVCTVGACGIENVPDLYLSMKGKRFLNWLVALFKAQGQEEKLVELFGKSRLVMGLSVQKDAARAYTALFDDARCAQDTLVMSAAVFANMTKDLAKQLFGRIFEGVMHTESKVELKPLQPIPMEMAPMEGTPEETEELIERAKEIM